MSREEEDYYQRRAEAEIALAQKAVSSGAVQAHYDMATAYLDRIYGETEEEGRPDPAVN
ncbi:MAG TPA: hypothetical protein VI381_07855 [Allosphingosinicella sp.]